MSDETPILYHSVDLKSFPSSKLKKVISDLKDSKNSEQIISILQFLERFCTSSEDQSNAVIESEILKFISNMIDKHDDKAVRVHALAFLVTLSFSPKNYPSDLLASISVNILFSLFERSDSNRVLEIVDSVGVQMHAIPATPQSEDVSLAILQKFTALLSSPGPSSSSSSSSPEKAEKKKPEGGGGGGGGGRGGRMAVVGDDVKERIVDLLTDFLEARASLSCVCADAAAAGIGTSSSGPSPSSSSSSASSSSSSSSSSPSGQSAVLSPVFYSSLADLLAVVQQIAADTRVHWRLRRNCNGLVTLVTEVFRVKIEKVNKVLENKKIDLGWSNTYKATAITLSSDRKTATLSRGGSHSAVLLGEKKYTTGIIAVSVQIRNSTNTCTALGVIIDLPSGWDEFPFGHSCACSVLDWGFSNRQNGIYSQAKSVAQCSSVDYSNSEVTMTVNLSTGCLAFSVGSSKTVEYVDERIKKGVYLVAQFCSNGAQWKILSAEYTEN